MAAEEHPDGALRPALTPADVVESLGREGWRGFTLLRRYLAENPRESRVLAHRVRSVRLGERADADSRTVRFSFVGDCLTTNLHDPLVLECLARGVLPEQRHARDHVSREVRDPASALWAPPPDVVVVVVSPYRRGPSPESVDRADHGAPPRFLESLIEDLRILRQRTDAVVLVHSFVPPEFRPLGLSDAHERDGVAEECARLNLELYERCREVPGTYVVEVASVAARSGGRWPTLHKTWFMGTFGVPEEWAPLLCREHAAAGAALRGLGRKCLVVDLDDTLWGGIVGEAGAGEVELGTSFPGNIYREIQRTVRGLHARGVILAINSRNNEEDAWRPFDSRPEMVLRRSDFAAWRINWGDKAANLQELSRELGLGLDSFVVLDDDPVVRSWIEEQLPEVHVLPAQDPLDMLHALATTRLFENLARTAEDELRSRSHAAARQRRALEGAAVDRASFLAGLGLEVTVGRAAADQLPRLAQLAQRTNQFNLTTRRYTQTELAALAADEGSDVLFCACRDRFADEGIAGLVVLHREGREWRIDAFALSCRVLGRGVERAVAAAICRFATEGGAAGLRGKYVPTTKNAQTEWFYRDLGFAALETTEEGSTWRLALPNGADLEPRWIRLRLIAERG